jgi:hypothetical protein
VKRLQQDSIVAVSVGNTTVDYRVDGVSGGEASLKPLNTSDGELLPAASAAATLVFSHAGGLVMLRGAMYRVGRDEIRFAESGRVPQVAEQRRKAARLPITLPATLTGLDEQGAPVGDQRKLVTRDLSLGGLAVATGGSGFPIGARLHFELVLTDGATLAGTGRVVRSASELCGVEFEQLAPADRVRLAGFLAAQQRTRAARGPTKSPRGPA